MKFEEQDLFNIHIVLNTEVLFTQTTHVVFVVMYTTIIFSIKHCVLLVLPYLNPTPTGFSIRPFQGSEMLTLKCDGSVVMTKARSILMIKISVQMPESNGKRLELASLAHGNYHFSKNVCIL